MIPVEMHALLNALLLEPCLEQGVVHFCQTHFRQARTIWTPLRSDGLVREVALSDATFRSRPLLNAVLRVPLVGLENADGG